MNEKNEVDTSFDLCGVKYSVGHVIANGVKQSQYFSINYFLGNASRNDSIGSTLWISTFGGVNLRANV